ncbi:MAG: nucleotidyltransferase family protein [Magnetococcales bacterium]|nr:nucleotidyltransferase family protein [Magnetococcales bacterium]
MTNQQTRPLPREAIILAGGLGQRLRALVPDLPKPMAPVGDKPFLARLLDLIARQGVERVILSVGYKSDVIMDHFGKRYNGLELVYAVEERALGTAGGIRLGLERVHGEQAFVLNGDTWFDAPLVRLAARFAQQPAGVVMAVKPMENCSRYGAIHLDGDRITGFQEKGLQGPGLINGGVFLLSAALREELTGCFSFESDFLQPRIHRMTVAAVVCEGFFIDIGIPEDYLAAQTLLTRPG